MRTIKPYQRLLALGIMLCSVLFVHAQKQSTLRTVPGGVCLCVPVSITQQPVSPSAVCPDNGVAQFTVAVTGTAPFTYQWRENGILISNNSVYSGTNTATLTITNPSVALNGKNYRCQISGCSNSCVITNFNAVLTVNNPPSDINNDGITDVNDFMIFQQQLNTTCTGCPEDINNDGDVDNEDFLQLLAYFNKSCL